MKIHNECTFLKPDGITKMENMYKATFVMESCLKGKNGWCNFPAAIFYTEEKHPQGSNYFALYEDRGTRLTKGPRFMITDGISATKEFIGLQIGDDIIYSRYRHDYRELGEAMIDGGRDYVKYNPKVGKLVKLKVVKDKLELVDVGQSS